MTSYTESTTSTETTSTVRAAHPRDLSDVELTKSQEDLLANDNTSINSGKE